MPPSGVVNPSGSHPLFAGAHAAQAGHIAAAQAAAAAARAAVSPQHIHGVSVAKATSPAPTAGVGMPLLPSSPSDAESGGESVHSVSPDLSRQRPTSHGNSIHLNHFKQGILLILISFDIFSHFYENFEVLIQFILIILSKGFW